MIIVKSPVEIAIMEQWGKILSSILGKLREEAGPETWVQGL